MILSPHILAGTAIFLNSPNPALGVVLAVGSHYLLDSLPHTEYEALESIRGLRQGQIKKALPFLLKITLDLGGGMLLAVGWASLFGYAPLWAFAGGVAGILPDGMTVLYHTLFVGNPILAKHNDFHTSVHADKIKWPYPMARIGLQILVIFLALTLISSSYQ